MINAVVTRTSITEQLEKLVLDRILEGSLAAGERINESRLAADLGASRTPLREALSRLHREGLVVSRPHYGFYVADLSGKEARDLYECLAMLEGGALAMSGRPPGALLDRLSEINGRLERAAKAAEGIALNTLWHRTLVSGCPNRSLLDVLEGIRTKVSRYEFAFFAAGPERIATSARLHRSILGHLRAGAMDSVREALYEHWMTDLDEIVPAEGLTPPAAPLPNAPERGHR